MMRWRIDGEWPEDVTRSVICFAPHTSFSDGFLGKILLWKLGIPHKCLMTKKYFRWFTSPFLRLLGFFPVGNAVRNSISLLKGKEDVNILICPEGQLGKTRTWGKGIFTISKEAGVPIVFAYMDYKNKRAGILGTLRPRTWEQVRLFILANYDKEWAKYPEKFEFPE